MTPKSPASGEYATEGEVEAAIHALSHADLLRLGRVGERFAASLRVHGVGVDGEDLLQTAIGKTWSGDRKWPKKVKLLTHLISTMSSIASHAKKKHKCVEPSDIAAEGGDEVSDPSPFRARTMGPEVEAAAHEQLARIREQFADDDEATLVIEGHADGLNGPAIQTDLGITQRQYETIMTRIRRGLDRKLGWRP